MARSPRRSSLRQVGGSHPQVRKNVGRVGARGGRLDERCLRRGCSRCSGAQRPPNVGRASCAARAWSVRRRPRSSRRPGESFAETGTAAAIASRLRGCRIRRSQRPCHRPPPRLVEDQRRRRRDGRRARHPSPCRHRDGRPSRPLAASERRRCPASHHRDLNRSALWRAAAHSSAGPPPSPGASEAGWRKRLNEEPVGPARLLALARGGEPERRATASAPDQAPPLVIGPP